VGECVGDKKILLYIYIYVWHAYYICYELNKWYINLNMNFIWILIYPHFLHLIKPLDRFQVSDSIIMKRWTETNVINNISLLDSVEPYKKIICLILNSCAWITSYSALVLCAELALDSIYLKFKVICHFLPSIFIMHSHF